MKHRNVIWTLVFVLALVSVSWMGPVHGSPMGMMMSGRFIVNDRPGTQGVLVLAHGGNSDWNQNVLDAVADSKLPFPTVVHFGMGIQSAEFLEESVETLESLGVREIAAVPLFVSSHSQILRQLSFLLGQGGESPFSTGLEPVKAHALIRMTTALDTAPEVGTILKDRLQEMSLDPQNETVILVAHGPVKDDDNEKWLAVMEDLSQAIRTQTPHKDIRIALLRDDADPNIRNEAYQHLRSAVEEISGEGRALVLPLLISSGGIEHKIIAALEGLDYSISDKGLLPHPVIGQWILRQVDKVFATQT